MQRLVICGLCLLGFAYPAVLPSDAAIVTNGTFDDPSSFSDDDSGSNADGWLTSTNPDASGGEINSILNEQGFLRTGTSTQESGHVAANALEVFFSLDGGTLETTKSAVEGAGIAQSITVNDGDMLSFDWNFLTNENPRTGTTQSDFAFWSLVEEGTTSSDINVLAVPNDADESSTVADFVDQTGFQSVSNYVLTSGTYLLGFGVVDVGDQFVNSALLIDNVQVTAAPPTAVPEPGSLALLGLGTAGIAWRRRRRKQAKDVALPAAEV